MQERDADGTGRRQMMPQPQRKRVATALDSSARRRWDPLGTGRNRAGPRQVPAWHESTPGFAPSGARDQAFGLVEAWPRPGPGEVEVETLARLQPQHLGICLSIFNQPSKLEERNINPKK